MTSAATIILVLYFIQGSLGHGLQQAPIVGVSGGHAVDIEHAPFMAAVLLTDTATWCAGSIIHERFVLTTAVCTEFPDLVVRVGSTRYDKGGTLHKVKRAIRRKSYSPIKRFINNVALLKLREPVTFGPTVALIKLADESVNIPAGLTANVTGWGGTEYDWFATYYLRQASVTVSPQDDCNNYYNSTGTKLSNKQICVNNKATGACMYDEGAPLTAGNLQIGIFSYGVARDGKPNVYEKVAPHLMWILRKIKRSH